MDFTLCRPATYMTTDTMHVESTAIAGGSNAPKISFMLWSRMCSSSTQNDPTVHSVPLFPAQIGITKFATQAFIVSRPS